MFPNCFISQIILNVTIEVILYKQIFQILLGFEPQCFLIICNIVRNIHIMSLSLSYLGKI